MTYSVDTFKRRTPQKHLPFSLAWVTGTGCQPITENTFGEHAEVVHLFHSHALFLSASISNFTLCSFIFFPIPKNCSTDCCSVCYELCSVGCGLICAVELYLPTDCMMSRSNGAARSGLRWVNIERTTTAKARVSSSYSSKTAPQSRHLSI